MKHLIGYLDYVNEMAIFKKTPTPEYFEDFYKVLTQKDPNGYYQDTVKLLTLNSVDDDTAKKIADYIDQKDPKKTSLFNTYYKSYKANKLVLDDLYGEEKPEERIKKIEASIKETFEDKFEGDMSIIQFVKQAYKENKKISEDDRIAFINGIDQDDKFYVDMSILNTYATKEGIIDQIRAIRSAIKNFIENYKGTEFDFSKEGKLYKKLNMLLNLDKATGTSSGSGSTGIKEVTPNSLTKWVNSKDPDAQRFLNDVIKAEKLTKAKNDIIWSTHLERFLNSQQCEYFTQKTPKSPKTYFIKSYKTVAKELNITGEPTELIKALKDKGFIVSGSFNSVSYSKSVLDHMDDKVKESYKKFVEANPNILNEEFEND